MHVFQGKLFAPVLCLVFFMNVGLVCLLPEADEDNCSSLIPATYDRNTAPQNAGQPARVFIQIEVIDLDEINEETMDLRLHFFIRAIWKDSRISLNSSDLPENCVEHIWNPDLMFEEAKHIDDIGQHNKRFIVRNGYLYLSQRLSFKVACMMNFHLYPFDTQECLFSIRFMATDDCSALLRWSDDEESPYRYKMLAIVITKDLDPLQFIIEKPYTSWRVKQNKFSSTNFTYLLAHFPLTRRLTGSIINYYMPSALLIIVSWFTFWLREDATAERVALIMTGLLTICTQIEQYKSELPPVNYIIAMDIWYFVCIFMLFAALLEFAFSYNTYRKETVAKSAKRNNQIDSVKHSRGSSSSEAPNAIFAAEDSKEAEEAHLSTMKMFEKIVHYVDTTKLDSICKVLFPSFFFTFTVIYWSYYYMVS